MLRYASQSRLTSGRACSPGPSTTTISCRIRKPALITHGAKDAVVKPEVVDQHKAGLVHAQIHIMPNVGHAAFWGDPPRSISAYAPLLKCAAL